MPASVRMSPVTAWHASARVGDVAHGAVGLARLEPVHEDGRALGGEHAGHPRAGAPVRAGDQCDLAVESEVHRGHPSTRVTRSRVNSSTPRAPQNAIAASNSVASRSSTARRARRAVDRQPPQHRPPHHHRAGAERQGLDHVGAGADPAVDVHLGPSGDGVDDLGEHVGGRGDPVEHPAAVVRDRDRRGAGVDARAASSPRSRPFTTNGSPLHSPNRARSSKVTDGSKSDTMRMMSELSVSSRRREVRVADPRRRREAPGRRAGDAAADRGTVDRRDDGAVPGVPAPFGERPGAAAVAEHVHLGPARAVGRGRRDLLRPRSWPPSTRRTRCPPRPPPRAVASSPSSAKKRCIAVGATRIGAAMSVPRTVVDRSMVDTSRSTWGSSAQRRQAATFCAQRRVRAAPAGQVLPRVRFGDGLRGALVRGQVGEGFAHSRMLARSSVGRDRPCSQRPARSARSSAMLSQASSGVCVMRLSARITGTANAMRTRERGTYRASTDREGGDQADPRARAHRRAQPEGHRGGGGPEEGGGGALVRDRPPELGRGVLELRHRRAAAASAAVCHHEDRQAHHDGDGRHAQADPHQALRRPPQLDDHRAACPGRTCHPLA